MLQDHDDYLWVGTFGGLARFDGERFRVFGSAEMPGLGSASIISLYESRSGALWIGAAGGGITRLDHGVAITYTERDGLPSGFINSIRGDAEGNVWGQTSGGLARFAGAKWEAYPTHRGRAVREFYLQARDGSMWFRNGREVMRFGADGSFATLTFPEPSVFLVHEARDGSVWIGVRDQYRLVRYAQGAFSDVPLPPIGQRELAAWVPEYRLAVAEDTDGELLLITPAGLVRTVGGKLSPPVSLRLPTNGSELPKVRSLLVDREGNVWVGMIGTGLVRLRPAPLTAFGRDEGLSDSSFNAVFQDREGRIWLGGDLLYWFDGHRFHRFPGVTDVAAIAQTRDGDLWFGGYGGLYRCRSGGLTHFQVDAPLVNVIYEDREGTLWIGGGAEERPGGLYRFREGKWDQIPGIFGVHQIIEDRDGSLLAAGRDGLFQVRGGKAIPYQHNQSVRPIANIYQESTGTFWLATYGRGLFRLRDGQLKAVTTKDGLPNNLLLGVLEDGKSNLWFSSNQNIFRLSLKELSDFADGKISSVLPVSYGIEEGMRSSECNGGSPGVWKTGDGRIWFPSVRGVVAIDPAAGSRLPPPVVLEEAWANQLMLARDGQTSATPGNNTFDFRFTALSFSAPEKLRFKYRLEPFDKDWVDAGTRRTAHYTNMPPGEYSFHVIAANGYGVWNDRGVNVRFVLRPHFYQTNWFYALCGVFFLALLWAAYQFRIRQLQRKFKQLQDVIDTIPAYVWSCLPDGYLDLINQRLREFMGQSFGQAVGRNWEEAFHPEDRAHFLEAWHAAVASGEAMECEARLRRADGQYRWSLIRNAPLHDKTGKIVKWYGTGTDIDDRKGAEETLRESEVRFRTFVDHATDAFFLIGDRGEVLDVNRQACESVGYSREELIGMTTRDFDPDADDALLQWIGGQLDAGVVCTFESHHRQKDGTVFPVEVRVRPFWQGSRRLSLALARDITDRRRAEEERGSLRQLEADLAHINRVSMMGELAASIAHEVNQPLSGIVSNGSACLRWLAGDPPNVEEVREAVRDIVRDGKRAGEVIARIRALTKRTSPPSEELDVNETIREVLAIAGDEAKRENVVFRTQFADNLLPVSGDRIQLQQVVLNLVMNGMEAMSSVGERARQLLISTRSIDPDQVQVTVEDSGVGLDPSTTARIFEPFFTTKSGGMGMGLSISRSILQNHGGRLWATLNNGPGTSFHFTLPKYHAGASDARIAGV
jgi:PAS domain S-box-containing protein